MLYPLLRQILFCLDPEFSHDLSLRSLQALHHTPLHRVLASPMVSDPYECMGLRFSNRVGLAAGLDKNGDYIQGLTQLGFGFLELGTVTPKPQAGNPKPRMFRLPEAQGIAAWLIEQNPLVIPNQ